MQKNLTELLIAARMSSRHHNRLPIGTLFTDTSAVQAATSPETLAAAAESRAVKNYQLVAPDDTDAIASFIKGLSQSPVESVVLIGIRETGLLFLSDCAAHNHACYTSADRLGNTTIGRLSGNVVLVTGSAQGFGRGIAQELAAAGAHVVIADLNAELGKQTAAEIARETCDNQATFVPLNVTDSGSLHSAFEETVATYGGLDILIANAGVLKAGPLDEMTEKDFAFVTSVNYTGYFNCVKAAAPLLKLQHAYNDSHMMDILQINSKSGLQGSNKNFAYAGSKFGTIGLTQSFAMELIPWNIKVNSICPGNFFDGPLWSDPERGLFVQYLNAGKVPGAKSIDDVRAFYMNKVPMKRGCLPRDVAKAILYAHEQEYETGQAIPVTGGQVMLK